MADNTRGGEVGSRGERGRRHGRRRERGGQKLRRGWVEKEVKRRLAQERSHPDVSITHDAPLQERDTHCVFAEVWDVCVCVVSSL